MIPCLMIFGNLEINNISPWLQEFLACWFRFCDSLEPTNTVDKGSCCISRSCSCGGHSPRDLLIYSPMAGWGALATKVGTQSTGNPLRETYGTNKTAVVSHYNMMVSALQLSKLPASTKISLLRQKISLWKFLLLNIPLYKIFKSKIAIKWSVYKLGI